MMRKLLVLLGVVGSFGFLHAQQDPQFTVGQYQGLAYQNPAVVGSHDAICATLLGRSQWVGFEGAPNTFLFSAETPVELFGSHGLGITIMSDKIAFENTMVAKLNYAYKFSGVGPGVLSAGIGIGYISKTLGSEWVAPEGTENDIYIPVNGATEGGFDLDFGLYYRIPKKLSIGISSTHLTASQFNKVLDEKTIIDESRLFNYRIDRTIYVSAQYETPIGQSGDWVLKPGLFVKTDIASTTYSLGALAEYQGKFWGGLDYRVQDAINLLLGANFQLNGESLAGGMIKVGYSYDFTTSEIRKHSSGSHEIFVRYCFNISSNPKEEEHHTVRFL